MNYKEILTAKGLSFETLQKKLTEYVSRGLKDNRSYSSNIHYIPIDSNVVVKIEFKPKELKRLEKRGLTQRQSSDIDPLSYVFDVNFYHYNQLIIANTDEFFSDFRPLLRSIATVYIIGNPLAFEFPMLGEQVKALISSDFAESLLSGAEGTTSSTGNIGDANIPLQSIADTFAVLHKHVTDQNKRTGTGVFLQPTPYPDVNNTDENSTYQVLSTTTGKPTGEETTEGVIRTNRASLGFAIQTFFPIRPIAVTTNPLFYIRSADNNSAEAWEPVLAKEKITSLLPASLPSLEVRINELTQKTRPAYDVFLAEDTSNGTPITSVGSYYPCYVGDGRVVYMNISDGSKLYIKSINNTSNGYSITSVGSSYPCYVVNGRIVYRNNSNDILYIKSINDTSNGYFINSVSSWAPCYVGNGRIVYRNYSDGGKLYIKSINDTSNGTPITSGDSYSPCYVGNGRIVYSSFIPGINYRLYIKSLSDTSNGTQITSVSSEYPCYVGNGRIVYRNGSDDGKLYIKDINDTSTGTPINSASSFHSCYVGDGRVVYMNISDGVKLYLKNIDIYS